MNTHEIVNLVILIPYTILFVYQTMLLYRIEKNTKVNFI